jgi:hypothetical protein
MDSQLPSWPNPVKTGVEIEQVEPRSRRAAKRYLHGTLHSRSPLSAVMCRPKEMMGDLFGCGGIGGTVVFLESSGATISAADS